MRKFLVVSVLFSLSFLVDLNTALSGFITELDTARSVQATSLATTIGDPTELARKRYFPAGSSISSGCVEGNGNCVPLPEALSL